MNIKRIVSILTLLLLAASPSLYAACSNSTLHGTYGYFSQGFISATTDISPALFLPQAQTGLVTFDGKGIVTSGTFTINTTDPTAEVSRGTFTGTYLINSDCRGTFETTLPDGGGSFHFDLLVLSPTELAAIQTDVGVSQIFSAKKIRAPEER